MLSAVLSARAAVRRLASGFVGAFLLLACHHAQATLLLYEPFSTVTFTTDNLDFRRTLGFWNLGNGTSATGCPVVSNAAALNYSGLVTSNSSRGLAMVANTTTTVRSAGASFTAQSSGAVYCSFLVNVATAPSSTRALLFMNSWTGGTVGATADRHDGGQAGVWMDSSRRLVVGKSATATASAESTFGSFASSTSAALTVGQTYLVVLKYKFNTGTTSDDEVSLYLNPTLASEPGSSDSATAIGADSAIQSAWVPQGCTVGGIGETLGSFSGLINLDEIRVGTTWADVTPAFSTPPTKLAITTVNGGSSPTVGAAFDVLIESQDAGGTPANVVSNTAVTLSLNSGSGTLGGTLTGTITAGTDSVTITGVTYSKAGSGVILTATRTSGDTLTAGNSSSFNVSTAVLTVTGVTASNKVYDGNTTATVSTNGAVLVGVIGGQTVTLTGTAAGTFANKTVGTSKAVTVTGLTLGGADAANYTLTQPSLSANITAVTLTVSSGLTANDKVYDGTTSATISSNSVVLSGVLVGDEANVRLSTNGYTASFATATVGSGNTVTVSGLTLTGSAAANYTLTQPSLSANITASAWFNASWTNRLAIVIDHNEVAGPLTNFPVLINITNASLQASAQSSGNDLLFTSVDGMTKLDHETESYTNSNGALVAWVKVPLLSSTTNTTLYLYYGNSSATNQQNATNVWDANYVGVWHLAESGNGTSGEFRDSTSRANHGQGGGGPAGRVPARTTGKVGPGQEFTAAAIHHIKIADAASLQITGSITLEGWCNPNSITSTGYRQIVARQYGSGSSDAYALSQKDAAGYFWGSNSINGSSLSKTNWYHLVASISGTASYIYINGVQSASAGGITIPNDGNPVIIGGQENDGTTTPSELFDGLLDEVRISNTPRSAAWVATEYNNQNSPSTFYSISSAESAPPTKLAITAVNSGSSPTVGAAFSVVVQSQDAGGTPRNVSADTTVTLSVNSGTGTPGGTVTGTITNGRSSVTISGVTYSKAESGVILTATRTSGDTLTAGNSSPFSVARASSSNAVSSSANPSPTGSSVTFTATLAVVAPGSGTPGGTAQFRTNGVVLGSPVALVNGVASLATASLFHGSHVITAEYAGDGNFLGSTNTLTPDQVINTSPTATGDSLQRYPTSGAKGRITTLLANDTDADGDALTFSSVSATSAQGGAVIAANGWVIYTRPDGFTNADSFFYVATDGGLQATGSVAITIVADVDPSQNVVAIDDLGNGDFRPRFFGIPGRTYTIQYTTNLVTPNWLSLGTAAASATGTFEFTDSPPPATPTRFYRSTYP